MILTRSPLLAVGLGILLATGQPAIASPQGTQRVPEIGRSDGADLVPVLSCKTNGPFIKPSLMHIGANVPPPENIQIPAAAIPWAYIITICRYLIKSGVRKTH